ncbi:MAG: carbamate kinase [Spirochaetaceae bacterium]|nr:carbamate kinase [Spirochaetaceae bacterium]
MKFVIALGGNALQDDKGPATAEAQLEVVKKSVLGIADLIEQGHTVMVSHGNGPQVGRIVIQNETASAVTPAMPFDVCGAMSQGYIGYHIQQALKEELAGRGINKNVVSLVTQVEVDANDKAFVNPTKPIGPFYKEEEAKKLQAEKGYSVKEDSGRGWRRVVASPKPVSIIELESVKTLNAAGHVVITVGGGGIPVVKEGKGYKGVAAVIDKDLASAKLAELMEADALIILTAVDKVAINFGKPNQENLATLNAAQAKEYIVTGQFGVGSMLPKVEAALMFTESKAGRKAIITSLEKVALAIKGEDGTIVKN